MKNLFCCDLFGHSSYLDKLLKLICNKFNTNKKIKFIPFHKILPPPNSSQNPTRKFKEIETFIWLLLLHLTLCSFPTPWQVHGTLNWIEFLIPLKRIIKARNSEVQRIAYEYFTALILSHYSIIWILVTTEMPLQPILLHKDKRVNYQENCLLLLVFCGSYDFVCSVDLFIVLWFLTIF